MRLAAWATRLSTSVEAGDNRWYEVWADQVNQHYLAGCRRDLFVTGEALMNVRKMRMYTAIVPINQQLATCLNHSYIFQQSHPRPTYCLAILTTDGHTQLWVSIKALP